MASDRAAFELTQQALQGRIEAAEQALLALLRNPMASWGASAIWQLAMCEFAVAKIEDSVSSPLRARPQADPAALVPRMFEQRPALRTLLEQENVLIQQYCDGLHWHNLVLFGP